MSMRRVRSTAALCSSRNQEIGSLSLRWFHDPRRQGGCSDASSFESMTQKDIDSCKKRHADESPEQRLRSFVNSHRSIRENAVRRYYWERLREATNHRDCRPMTKNAYRFAKQIGDAFANDAVKKPHSMGYAFRELEQLMHHLSDHRASSPGEPINLPAFLDSLRRCSIFESSQP